MFDIFKTIINSVIIVSMTVQEIKEKIVSDLIKQGVIKAAVFGSTARNEAKKESDIDILVDFQDKKSLLDIVRLQFILEDKLGKKIDILTYGSINPLLKDIILKDEKIIYEKTS